jgi:hypothetical protein
MKTGPDTLAFAENESGSSKHEYGTRRSRNRRNTVGARKIRKLEPTPSVPPKTSPGVENMKTGWDALGTAEKESVRAKHQMGPEAPDTAENESRCAKCENGTIRPRYRRK